MEAAHLSIIRFKNSGELGNYERERIQWLVELLESALEADRAILDHGSVMAECSDESVIILRMVIETFIYSSLVALSIRPRIEQLRLIAQRVVEGDAPHHKDVDLLQEFVEIYSSYQARRLGGQC